MQSFINIGAYDWICPFISGFISIKYCTLDQNGCDFVLISRRDKRRAGTRFWSRGADIDGNVTNMAETEQFIVLTKENEITIYSYSQTRGSMPFQWSSDPNLKWAPSGKIIGDKSVNLDISKKHFDDQLQNFSKQLCVNLVDKNKSRTQKMLGQYFEDTVSAMKNNNIKHVWFDFHHECRNMKWENLSKLIDIINKDIQASGYFGFTYLKSKPNAVKVNSMQKGVIRTNCMDCLDRTNVVQSVIARNIFLSILHTAQVIAQPDGNPFQKFPDKLEEIFRENWTRNADVISILYTGTGALKTDFTRTGKRTTGGAIQDAQNSIQRYFLNNFSDGYKQNSLDVLLNKIDVKQTSVSKPFNRIIVTLIFAVILFQLIQGSLLKIVIGDPSPAQGIQQFNQGSGDQIKGYLVFLVSLGMVMKIIQLANGFLVPKPLKK